MNAAERAWAQARCDQSLAAAMEPDVLAFIAAIRELGAELVALLISRGATPAEAVSTVVGMLAGTLASDLAS